MIRLTLLCCAATAAVRSHAFPLDEPIVAIPPEEVLLVADRLPRAAPTLASPRLRARQTADILRLAPAIVPALDDLAVGRWAGRSLRDLERAEPEALAAWRRDPAACPHGGESLRDLRVRVGGWLDTVRDRRGDVLAITHPAVIRTAVLCALSAPDDGFWHIDVPPLASVVLTGFAGRWNLRV